jgi:hypothetical protein
MKRLLAWLGVIAFVIAMGIGAFVLAARCGWLRPDDTELRARYALPASRFETIGKQALHIVDEGSGPPVVLVHGSYASLRQWDHWADLLKGQYRVIRFDRPAMGLSGPSAMTAGRKRRLSSPWLTGWGSANLHWRAPQAAAKARRVLLRSIPSASRA